MRGKLGYRLLFLLFLFGFTWLIISRFANLRDLLRALSQGQWQWVLAAAILHFVYFYMMSIMYQVSFATVGVKNRAWELFPVLMSALAVNALAPTGGAGGAAIFINYNVKRGESGTRTAIGIVLDLIADLSTLIPFMIWGMVYLIQQHQMKSYEAVGFAFYTIFIVLLCGLLLAAWYKSEGLNRFLGGFQGLVNRIGRRAGRAEVLKADWAQRISCEYLDGARVISEHPIQFLRMLVVGIAMHVVNLAGLYLFFLAYRQPVSLGTLIAAFSLGFVFFVITIIPEGVGAVEGIMALVFIAMGIPQLTAITITVAFRGVNFWLPLLLGLIFLKKVT